MNIVDVPSGRRIHKNVTPRGGGVAIFLTFCIVFSAEDYLANASFDHISYILPPLFFIAVASFIDDIKHVSIVIRLIVHIVSAAFAIYYFVPHNTLFHGTLPIGLDFLLAVICLVGFLNIYNFLDGIDGITSAESIHISITLMILSVLGKEDIINSSFVMLSSAIVLGSSIGFLRYNWYPAKIFLGDVGSITLGFLLGTSLVIVAASSKTLFVSVCILSLYYTADGGLTILIRLMNGEKIWLPHLKHFFQKAVRRGMSHQEVTIKITLCNLCLMLLSITALYYPIPASICALLTVTTLLIHFNK